MSFVRRLATIFPAFGQPLSNDTVLLRQGVSLTDGANTVTVPSSGSFSPTMSTGRVRVKIYNGTGTSPAVTKVTLTGTDGTTTETFDTWYPDTSLSLSSTAWFDKVFIFLSELNLTSISCVATLSGTSEGASMDIEVLGTI